MSMRFKSDEMMSILCEGEENEDMHVFPLTIEESVMRAASVVSAEIREGAWSSERKEEESKDKMDVRCHLHMVAASIEKFSVEMILPSLLTSGEYLFTCFCFLNITCFVDVPDDGDGPYRSFLATLLMLRETILLNYESFFNSGCGSRGTSNLEKNSYKILATGLIISALRRFRGNDGYSLENEVQKDVNALTVRFLEIVESYDSGNEEFASFLKKPLNDTVGITPAGRVLGKEENSAWIDSFNRSREKHPLLEEKNFKLSKFVNHTNAPSSNACSMFLVEKTPTQQMNEHFNIQLENNQKIREERVIKEYEKRIEEITQIHCRSTKTY